jgi:hypothetical protein
LAACLLLADVVQAACANRYVNPFELFMAGITLTAGAGFAASAEPWWRDCPPPANPVARDVPPLEKGVLPWKR